MKLQIDDITYQINDNDISKEWATSFNKLSPLDLTEWDLCGYRSNKINYIEKWNELKNICTKLNIQFSEDISREQLNLLHTCFLNEINLVKQKKKYINLEQWNLYQKFNLLIHFLEYCISENSIDTIHFNLNHINKISWLKSIIIERTLELKAGNIYLAQTQACRSFIEMLDSKDFICPISHFDNLSMYNASCFIPLEDKSYQIEEMLNYYEIRNDFNVSFTEIINTSGFIHVAKPLQKIQTITKPKNWKII